MSVVPSVISAVAASVAAILAGVTVYISGRRENRKWLRDSLIDAYVEYLDASFRSRGAYARIARVEGYDAGTFNDMHSQTDDAYNAQGLVLTRLRLIAPKSVVSAAEALHLADYGVLRATFCRQQPIDDDEWCAARDEQHRARERFIHETRYSLRLGRGNSVTRGFEFPGP
ncbi:hypothetical protein [Nocardia nova]|uniref:hypothetical protein n=1 Tax=Nocardia nova TaxID=37330 RepID=UPI0011B02B63|nr:hypothetical protein [Nocardia nova]